MPSFEDQGVTMTALQAFTTSSLAANSLKSIIENPLRFEKADLSVSTGLSGRYVPLNKPFTIHHGTSNGIKQNGIHRPASSGVENSDTNDDDKEGDHHMNGEKSGQLLEERISTQWPRVLTRPQGLKNYSNTCYMNSTLQALMHIPPFVGYLLNGTHGWQCSKNSRGCAFCRLERHARESYPETHQRLPFLDPSGIIGKTGGSAEHDRKLMLVLTKFHTIHKQEDAHEFFLHLLDKLDEADKRVHHNPKYKTIIQKIFGGECRQSITCDMDDCGHVSHTSQAFLDLSLDLLARGRDIESSLEDFTRQETLSHDNQYKCEKCNTKSRAKKTTTIHSAPSILTIHLKRFSASGLRKNTGMIHYPEELDLNPFMSEESRGIPKYRLIATICHHGFDYSGMGSGHYTANCMSSSGPWNEFDDTKVARIQLDEVLKDRDAYILFYARDDPGMEKGSTRVDSAVNGLSTPNVKIVNGNSSSSGKKRSMDGGSDEPSKRQRVSDDEDDDVEIIKLKSPISRRPLTSINTENHISKPSATQRTYTKSFGTTNDHQNLVSLPNPTRPPYSPKIIPPPPRNTQSTQNKGSSRFFEQVHGSEIPQKRPEPGRQKQHAQNRSNNAPPPQHHRPHHNRRRGQLDITHLNPAMVDSEKDPFVAGYNEAERRHSSNKVHIRYPGIKPQYGSTITSSFVADSNQGGMMSSGRDGIKVGNRRGRV